MTSKPTDSIPQMSEAEVKAARKAVQDEVGSSRAPDPTPRDRPDPNVSAEAMKEGAEAFLQSLDSIDMTLLAVINRLRRSSAVQMTVGALMTVTLLTLGYVAFVIVNMAHEVNGLVKEQREAMTKLTETQQKVADTQEKVARTEEKVQQTKDAVQEVVDTAPKVEIDEDTGKATVVVPVKKPKEAEPKSVQPPAKKVPKPAPTAQAPPAAPAPAPQSVKMPLGVEHAEAF